MFIRKIFAAIYVCVCLPVFSFNIFACACCAEPGAYSISVKKPEKFELDELRKIRFATANLFTTAAGEDNIKGISSVGENYSLNGLFQGSTWKLNLKDNKGRIGTLVLPMPTTAVAFAADIHDGKQGGAGGPLLYKEWRFKYKVQSGTGIFQMGIAPATEYFLVFQGRGNVCTQAEDFTHWRLEINGRKANYAFYGELSSGKRAVSQNL
jgi:hypothetical protein